MRTSLLLRLVIAVVMSSCVELSGAHAQLTKAPDVPASGFAAGERDRQFDELARDVEAMQRELSIYKRVVTLVAPSVVHIQAKPLAEYQFRRDVEEAGSGVIVAAGGRNWVLTNRHVVRHSDIDHVELELNDGTELKPTRIISDPETDVAVLEIDGQDLVPARIGNSDLAEIGDIVMAFGSPFNLRQSVTRGIISAKGRSNLDLGEGEVDYQNFMQTDAAINPGNSGGPLVNLRGEVIGINTAIASNSGGNDGIGFSIPINIADAIMRQLVERGQVDRGFLGVTLDGYFDAQAARLVGLSRLTGARVKDVTPGSPAAAAGLQAEDVILRYGGAVIESDDHLISLVKLSVVGQKVGMLVLRGGQMMQLEAVIGRFDPAAAPR